MKKRSAFRPLAFSLWAVVVAVFAPVAFAQQANPPASHPFAESKPIHGRYIVVFKTSVRDAAAETANVMRGAGGQLHHTYANSIKGFSATLPDAALPSIRNNPNVDYIELDQTVSLNQVTQNQATWGLDRIDQRDLALNNQYAYNSTGLNVNAFIIDTGIQPDHVEFTGRLLLGYDVVADSNGTSDCNGHGTHVAGTVGGTAGRGCADRARQNHGGDQIADRHICQQW